MPEHPHQYTSHSHSPTEARQVAHNAIMEYLEGCPTPSVIERDLKLLLRHHLLAIAGLTLEEVKVTASSEAVDVSVRCSVLGGGMSLSTRYVNIGSSVAYYSFPDRVFKDDVRSVPIKKSSRYKYQKEYAKNSLPF